MGFSNVWAEHFAQTEKTDFHCTMEVSSREE